MLELGESPAWDPPADNRWRSRRCLVTSAPDLLGMAQSMKHFMFCIRRNNNLHASLCLTHPSLYLQPVAEYIVVVAGCLLEGKAKQRIHLNPLATTFLQVSINHSLDALKPLLVSLSQYHNSVFGVCVLLF